MDFPLVPIDRDWLNLEELAELLAPEAHKRLAALQFLATAILDRKLEAIYTYRDLFPRAGVFPQYQDLRMAPVECHPLKCHEAHVALIVAKGKRLANSDVLTGIRVHKEAYRAFANEKKHDLPLRWFGNDEREPTHRRRAPYLGLARGKAIADALVKMSVDPMCVPPHPHTGKSGLREKVWLAVCDDRELFRTQKAFDEAWKRAFKDGHIRRAPKE